MKTKDTRRFYVDLVNSSFEYSGDFLTVLHLYLYYPKKFKLFIKPDIGRYWDYLEEELVIYFSGPSSDEAHRSKPKLDVVEIDVKSLEIMSGNPYGLTIRLIHQKEGAVPETSGGSILVGI